MINQYCPADFNFDGEVDAGDLALMLGAWYSCQGYCPYDFNDDEIVDANDLAILLGAWGPCSCSNCASEIPPEDQKVIDSMLNTHFIGIKQTYTDSNTGKTYGSVAKKRK